MHQLPQKNSTDFELGARAMTFSVAASAIMLLGKMTAYFITGSTAILSDAIESVVHVVVTGFSAISYRIAEKPADRRYPYGYGKIVIFSIALEGILIFLAALYVLVEAIQSLIHGPELAELGVGILITAALGVINLGLGFYLLAVGKRIGSPVVEANGQHVLTDMWTSFVVVAGVGVVWLTGLEILDPILAIVAAIHILLTGVQIVRRAYRQAVDAALPEDSEAILSVLQAHRENGDIIDFHSLRHRRSNKVLWAEVHLLFSQNLSLVEAHARATRIEQEIREKVSAEDYEITSHLEPENHELAHPHGHDREDPFAHE